MTNKQNVSPMLSVERDLLESVVNSLEGAALSGYPSPCEIQELRALLDAGKVNNREMDLMQYVEAHPIKPATQHHGEPVACLTRSRNIPTQASISVDGKDHFSAWSAWEPNSIEYGRAVTDPLRNDPVCYEIELLFKEQPAPVAVIMPKYMKLEDNPEHPAGKWVADIYNSALDEVARLNGIKK